MKTLALEQRDESAQSADMPLGAFAFSDLKQRKAERKAQRAAERQQQQAKQKAEKEQEPFVVTPEEMTQILTVREPTAEPKKKKKKNQRQRKALRR